MYKPEYDGNSILNLMSSIKRLFKTKSIYPELQLLKNETFKDFKNIVLIILDGFGYDYMMSKPNKSLLHHYLKGKITSVYPTTTASAVTTFLTSLPPIRHGVTGWYLYLKEIGCLIASLLWKTRGSENNIINKELSPSTVYTEENIFKSIDADSFLIYPDTIIDSIFSVSMTKGSVKVRYSTLSDFFNVIKETVRKQSIKKKFIIAYYTEFDSIQHEYGQESETDKNHYKYFIEQLEKNIIPGENPDTVFIITADHGLIESPQEKIIELSDHPELYKMLLMPLSCEPRNVFCHIKNGYDSVFIEYIKKHFSNSIELYKSIELLETGYFGNGVRHANIKDRIGDYTLIMKENYIMKDRIPGETNSFKIGNHGGLSHNEMYVPLILIN